jgi:hypothetical protein
MHKKFKIFLYYERKSACSWAEKEAKGMHLSGVMRLTEREKPRSALTGGILPGRVGREMTRLV